MTTDKVLLTIPEAAEYMGVCDDTIRRHIRSGQIRAMKLGRIYRVSRRVLDELIDADAKLPKPARTLSEAREMQEAANA